MKLPCKTLFELRYIIVASNATPSSAINNIV
jgi:hypothetical protein